MRTHRILLLSISLLFLGAAESLWVQADSITPNLHRIAAWGQSEMVELLLENGADPNERDLMDRTALHKGARYPRVVRVLLDAGADPNLRDRFDNTPLHLATVDYDSVRLLIEGGATVNAKNSIERTPLDIALRQGSSRSNRKIVQLLLESEAR